MAEFDTALETSSPQGDGGGYLDNPTTDAGSFDTGVNVGFHQNLQDTQSSMVQTILGGATATVVDTAASIWNSLPGTAAAQINTADVLKRTSGEALKVYEEHPDAVHLASFIAGSFVPSGLAMKGMGAMRAGVKGVNWFSTAGKEADMALVEKLFQEGGAATKEYRAAKNALYAKGFANQALDAVAAEFAVVGLMNNHPMMEDYMKDPVKNFAISAAFGGVLGGTIGTIADHFAISARTGAIEAAALDTRMALRQDVTPNMTNAVQLQKTALNASSYDNFIANKAIEGLDETSDLTVALMSKSAKIERETNLNVFEGMISPELKALPVETKLAIKAVVETSPEMMGVEKLRTVTKGEMDAVAVRPPSAALSATPNLEKNVTTLAIEDAANPSKNSLATVAVNSVYFAAQKLYGTVKDLKYWAGASALSTDATFFERTLGKNFGRVPNDDSLWALNRTTSAAAQGEYIGAAQRVAKWSEKDVSLAHIDETDGALLNALVMRASVDPVFAELKIGFGLPPRQPTAKAVAKEAEAARKTQHDAVLGPEGNVAFKDGTAISTELTSGPLTTVRIGDLNEILLQQKQAAMKTLLKAGFPFEVTALRTNTPAELVQLYAAHPDKEAFSLALSKIPASQHSILSSLTDIPKILDPAKQPLVLTGNKRKNAFAPAWAQMSNKMQQDMNTEIISTILQSSPNVAVRDVGALLDEFKPGFDVLRQKLGVANNELGGNAVFNSFDFFSRNMKDVGPVVSAMGKRLTDIKNAAVERVVSPLADAYQAVVNEGASAIYEMNLVKGMNDGLAGYRVYKDKQIWQKVTRQDETGAYVTVLEAVKTPDGKAFSVTSAAVDKAMTQAQATSADLKNMANASKKITGSPNVNDIGLWMPSFNPVGKHIAYLHDLATDTTQLIWANSKQEYSTLVNAFKKKIQTDGLEGKTIVVEKDSADQGMWSRLNGRMDPITMKAADTTQFKAGSTASAIPRTDTAVFSELANGYTHYINSQMRTIADLSMADITDNLRAMSKLNNWSYDAQPLTAVQKVLQQPKDTARVMLNTLLGEGNLQDYEGWKWANKTFETALGYSSNLVAKAWNNSGAQLLIAGKKLNKDGSISADALAKMDYTAFAKDLEKKGIPNAFAAFDDDAAKMFGLSKLEDHPDTSKRIIHASNALAATLLLRVGELAQPIVNMISMPILSSLAIANKQPLEFMGNKLATNKASGVQVMFEGARASNSPLWKRFDKMWEDAGFYKPFVSEANSTLQASRSFNKGFVSTVEKALDSRFVEIMSKPADWAETFTRRQAMFTGGVLAKRLYPELDDAGVTIFARDFMDKSLGNFHSNQRPVFFQGTLGVALGLFQTYSLTLFQNMYRHLELKNYKALGQAALLQSGIFGTSSLPGFSAVSQAIGEHFSDDNVDLVSGSYRALPNKMADTILYGLPSNLGAGLHTRGDSDPRFPGLSGDSVVAINFAKQAAQAVGSVAGSLSGQSPDIARALGEAISLQNMSRPLARGAELATGYAVTRNGSTVQTPEEVWTATGVMARVLGTRPFQETKLREAMHLNSYYGSIDHDARERLTTKLRTSIRNDSMTDETNAKFFEEYMRHGGTPTGARSAIRTALAKTSTDGKEQLVDKLKPNNPLIHMMDSLDGSGL